MPIWTERPAEDGATATEYVLLLALIALIAAVGITLFGGTLQSVFGNSVAEVDTTTSST